MDVDGVEEFAKLDAWMTLVELAEDLATPRVERRKQSGRALARVVVGSALGLPRPHRKRLVGESGPTRATVSATVGSEGRGLNGTSGLDDDLEEGRDAAIRVSDTVLPARLSIESNNVPDDFALTFRILPLDSPDPRDLRDDARAKRELPNDRAVDRIDFKTGVPDPPRHLVGRDYLPHDLDRIDELRRAGARTPATAIRRDSSRNFGFRLCR